MILIASPGFPMSESHQSPPASPYASPRLYGLPSLLAGILALMVWQSLHDPVNRGRDVVWLINLGLLTAFAVIAGRGVSGYWRGILIDSRNRLSLSRLQMLAWTLVVLSAVLTVAFTNLSSGADAALRIGIPSELLVAMGISTASLLASPLILNTRREQPVAISELERTVTALHRQGATEVDPANPSVLIRNVDPCGARWGDLVKGEEAGNAATVDLGRLQMLLITFVLIASYGALLMTLFRQGGTVSALPGLDAGMNLLLGISHTGYLTSKAMPHSQTGPAIAAPTP